MNNIIFTTGYLKLSDQNFKSPKNYFIWFEKLCKTSINLVVYTNLENYNSIYNISIKYPNVLHIINIEIEELQVYKWIKQYENSENYKHIKLPEIRNLKKDTLNYFIMMNSKIDLIMKTYKLGQNDIIPLFKNYAWIDFGIFNVFQNEHISSIKLNTLNTRIYPDKYIACPGCWNICTESIVNKINWRFCGGVIIINNLILETYHDIIMKYLENYIFNKGQITWEVNIWADIEREIKLNFGWFSADHNDSIINF